MTEKLSGLPPHWPKSTAEELRQLPLRLISVGKGEQAYLFKNNFVKTSKYETYNFLPKFLMEEFNPKTKMANVYFFIVGCLQTIPQITNTFGIPTTFMPLLVVVLVDAIFQIIEDLSRHKADKEANSSLAHRYNSQTKQFEDIPWYAIQVGDCIQLLNRETVPCDCLIFCCHEKTAIPEGRCYVETKSLDGETNLKLRQAMKNSVNHIHTVADLGSGMARGKVEMEHPNKLIENFTGAIEFDSAEMGREAIQVHNLLLRGCVLRNTDWVIALVINTGHDTKIMMSATETPSKSSSLESRASQEIRRIVVLLAIVCLIGTTGATIWNADHLSTAWYLDWETDPGAEWIIKFFYFFLLHATFIPVSLYVSMTMVRFFQSYFMNNDLHMYYEPTDTPAKVRTMTLNEQLGQISHIFSDKTGTLTCNVMDFKKCSINGIRYGRGFTEIGKIAFRIRGKKIPQEDIEAQELAKQFAKPHVTFYDPGMDADLKGNARGTEHKTKIEDFFRILSVCHSVVPEHAGTEIKLSASSPDDEALVSGAAYFGFSFTDRTENLAMIATSKGEERIGLLEVLDFTSTRKRMSVVIRLQTGQLRIVCKGADTVMLPRLRAGQQAMIDVTNDHMNSFAEEGLRCLVVGYCDLQENQFHDWHMRYHHATSDVSQIEARKLGHANAIDDLMDAIEQNFIIVGSTAIEDRLQDGVPEAIADLARAGIKLWVLTGDKEETAINISAACNLLLPEEAMKRTIINKSTCPTGNDMKTVLLTEIKMYHDDESAAKSKGGMLLPRSLIIDGPSLIEAMNDDVKPSLLEFSKHCQAVVACRVSPDQKRQMVNMVKDGVVNVKTLAIGDGANDVAMIQAAHIGVGISGQEGMQAVNASDFAIAQFKFLKKLLIGHGRWNYRRLSKLICYMFYKNIFMSIAQFWFATLNGFSGQKFYTEAGIQMFNLLFTSFPILLIGTYDVDVPWDIMNLLPELYVPCIRDYFFRVSLFWKWMAMALIDAAIVTYVPFAVMVNADPETGTLTNLWEYGYTTYTAVIFIASIKLLNIQNRWTWVHGAVVFVSILLWFIVAFIVAVVFIADPDGFGSWNGLMKNDNFWLTIILVVAICNGKDMIIKGLARELFGQPHQKIQESEKVNKDALAKKLKERRERDDYDENGSTNSNMSDGTRTPHRKLLDNESKSDEKKRNEDVL